MPPKKTVGDKVQKLIKKVIKKSSAVDSGVAPIPGVDLVPKSAPSEHGGGSIDSYVGTGAGLSDIWRHIQERKQYGWTGHSRADGHVPSAEELDRMQFGSVLLPEIVDNRPKRASM